MSDQIAVMNGGIVEQVGTPEQIYQRPRTRFVASFLGAMNWIDGIGIRPEYTRIAIAPGSRPAAAQIDQDGTAQKAAAREGGALRAVVKRCVFLGAVVHVETTLESGDLAVAQVSATEARFCEGDAVFLQWNATDELRFE